MVSVGASAGHDAACRTLMLTSSDGCSSLWYGQINQRRHFVVKYCTCLEARGFSRAILSFRGFRYCTVDFRRSETITSERALAGSVFVA